VANLFCQVAQEHFFNGVKTWINLSLYQSFNYQLLLKLAAGMSAGLIGWGAGIGVPAFFFVLIFCCVCLWCIRQRR